MKLSTALKTYGYEITSGEKFLWKCWPKSHCIDIDKDNAFISIIYDLNTLEIHNITVELSKHGTLFKWYKTSSLKSYRAESKERKIILEEDNPSFVDYEIRVVSSKEILDIVSLKLLS